MCHLPIFAHQNLMNGNTMSYHPTGVVLEIVGTDVSDQGRSCKEHACCGRDVLQEDVVVRLRKTVIEVNGKEERAIEAVWVTDGCDRCRVGFLQRHMTFHSDVYDGALAQVTAVLSNDAKICNTEQRSKYYKMRGCCLATVISMHGSEEGHAEDGTSDGEEDCDDDRNGDEDRLLTQSFTPQKLALED